MTQPDYSRLDRIAKTYAPYHTLPAFWQGVDDYEITQCGTAMNTKASTARLTIAGSTQPCDGCVVTMQSVFNFRRRKVGGIWFFKLGRLNVSFCISRPKRAEFPDFELRPDLLADLELRLTR